MAWNSVERIPTEMVCGLPGRASSPLIAHAAPTCTWYNSTGAAYESLLRAQGPEMATLWPLLGVLCCNNNIRAEARAGGIFDSAFGVLWRGGGRREPGAGVG